MTSPNGTYDLAPPILLGQFFATGSPPASPPGFSEVQFDPTQPLFVLVDGAQVGPLGFAEVLAPGGNLHIYSCPVGLTGSSVILQALVSDNAAANGFFAITNGMEYQIM